MSTNEVITIFNHDEFGSVRALMIDGEPWFAGTDVAACLEYVKPNQAITDNVEREDIKKLTYKEISLYLADTANEWGNINSQGMRFINESGLYSLIFNSKMPKAKEFKKWVTSEVLPSIRKTGKYEIDKTKTGLDLIQEYRNMLDRWQEAEEQKLLIQQQHEEYKTYVKENKYDRYGKPNYDNKSFRQCAKEYGLNSANQLINILVGEGYGRRIKSKSNAFKPYHNFIDANNRETGYFHVTTSFKPGYGLVYQWRITPLGYEYFEEVLFEEYDDDYDEE